jgi:hypothetical protein
MGHAVEALCYKTEGHEFESRWDHLIFSIYLILPSAPWSWGLLSLYQKWVPEDISGSKAQPERKANNLTVICKRLAEWTPFQTHYFSENLVAPGIEPGTFLFIHINEFFSPQNMIPCFTVKKNSYKNIHLHEIWGTHYWDYCDPRTGFVYFCRYVAKFQRKLLQSLLLYRWRQQVSPKHSYLSTRLHNVTF